MNHAFFFQSSFLPFFFLSKATQRLSEQIFVDSCHSVLVKLLYSIVFMCDSCDHVTAMTRGDSRVEVMSRPAFLHEEAFRLYYFFFFLKYHVLFYNVEMHTCRAVVTNGRSVAHLRSYRWFAIFTIIDALRTHSAHSTRQSDHAI